MNAWTQARYNLTKDQPNLVSWFNFDNTETNLNYICNGWTRRTFPRKDRWYSERTVWVRQGLEVWDFMFTQAGLVMPQQVVIKRTIKKWTVELHCEVEEWHLQTKQELGELSIFLNPVYSTVCGRAVLRLIKMTVTHA